MADSGMAALEGDPLDIVPTEDMIPTLSSAAIDYRPERDTTACFPIDDCKVIQLETTNGKNLADRCMEKLRIRKEV